MTGGRAWTAAGRLGYFPPDEASPGRTAARIRVSVLLLRGGRDHETPAAHSQRIFRALVGSTETHVVREAGHDDVLGRAESWEVVGRWLSFASDLAGLHRMFAG
jgi:pimeloyl-ACP methyl ester carboxylesterase